MSAPDARVAVVVVTRDRVSELLVTLGHLCSLPEQPRIIVVDNASSDGTSEIVRHEHPEVQVIALEENLGASGRNIGVKRADAPYVAFSDDDSWWEPGALRQAADTFDAHPGLGLLAGRVLVGSRKKEDPICAKMAYGALSGDRDVPGPPVLGFLACSAVVRRSAYLSVGGFEPRLLIGGEESLLAADLAAAGWRLAYIENVVTHHQPSTVRDRRTRRRTILRNDLWFTWLRRPLSTIARHTLCLMRLSIRDTDARAALIGAVRSLPWALRKRRVLPSQVEVDLRMLDRERGIRTFTG